MTWNILKTAHKLLSQIIIRCCCSVRFSALCSLLVLSRVPVFVQLLSRGAASVRIPDRNVPRAPAVHARQEEALQVQHHEEVLQPFPREIMSGAAHRCSREFFEQSKPPACWRVMRAACFSRPVFLGRASCATSLTTLKISDNESVEIRCPRPLKRPRAVAMNGCRVEAPCFFFFFFSSSHYCSCRLPHWPTSSTTTS